MLPDFYPRRNSWLLRAARVVCVLLVFSYILFYVLDLDGSNFPSLLTPVERPVIVAEVPSDAKLHDFPESVAPSGASPPLFTDRSGEYTWLQQTRVLRRFSPLDSARSHGYRVGLPRGDSVPDPLLSAFWR